MVTAIAVVIVLLSLALIYRFWPTKMAYPSTQVQAPVTLVQEVEAGIPVSAIAPLFEPRPEPELGGTTIYSTPATLVSQDGRTIETTIAIKDGGSGWVVVWDNQLGFFDNFVIAGSKAEVTFKEGQLRLAPCAMGGSYVVSSSHKTPDSLEAMFERLRQIEAVAA